MVDANEAPKGFFALLKSEVKGNPCKSCDWREICLDHDTDLLAYGHRCMSYAIIANRNGETYCRRDKQSVIFKSKQGELCLS